MCGLHLAETLTTQAWGVGFANVSSGGGLHDGHGTRCGLGRNTQSDVGLLKTIQATIIEHGCIASQQGVADVAQNDFSIAQTSCHAAVGIAVTTSLDQASVLANHACYGIRNDAGGVGCDGVNSVETLVALTDVGTQTSEVATTDRCSFGVSADDRTGKCVEHWGQTVLGGGGFWCCE